jgi:peroxiredoxin
MRWPQRSQAPSDIKLRFWSLGLMHDPHLLPSDLPVPLDDGASDHLLGAQLPHLALASTRGGTLDMADATNAGEGLLVLYVYPRTGRPGEPLPHGWDGIPGARGCTPQSCAFRDHAADLAAYDAAILGLSAQSPADQLEFATREHIPYPLLSDPGLLLADALSLPTFETAGMRLYKRLTLIAQRGRIMKVFYPVFPPERNAADVVAWLAAR